MARAKKKTWRDLTTGQKRAVVGGGAVELVVTAIAVQDLVRRPRFSVRGSKSLWLLSFVVQPFGPLAYLMFGRRPPG